MRNFETFRRNPSSLARLEEFGRQPEASLAWWGSNPQGPPSHFSKGNQAKLARSSRRQGAGTVIHKFREHRSRRLQPARTTAQVNGALRR